MNKLDKQDIKEILSYRPEIEIYIIEELLEELYGTITDVSKREQSSLFLSEVLEKKSEFVKCYYERFL